MRKAIIILVFTFFSCFPVKDGTAESLKVETSPRNYVLEKLKAHDLVFMGTIHKQPAILQLITDLLPHLIKTGVTHLAMEIASDQQVNLDRFFATGRGMEQITLHRAIECRAYRHLLQSIQNMPATQRPLVRAVDLPVSFYEAQVDRDQWMSQKLELIFSERKDAKVMMVVGSLHVLHKRQWQPHIKTGALSIQTRLRAWRSDLSIFAIANIAGTAKQTCDFGRALARASGAVATDIDERFRDWTLGLARCIAIVPVEPYELVDGVIVY